MILKILAKWDANAGNPSASRSAHEFIERIHAENIRGDHLAKGFQLHMETMARYGDRNALRSLLNAGAWQYPEACESALLTAAGNGHKLVIETLAHSKAGFGKSSFSSALLVASAGNWSQMLPMLVALGADVNAVDSRGDTALVSAIRARSRESAFKLIELGADRNTAGERGTPLMHAAEYADFEMCQLLITMGADPNAQKFGWRAIDYARDVRTIHFIDKWRTIKLLEQYKASSYALE